MPEAAAVVNHQRRNKSEIPRDVDYAFGITRNYLYLLGHLEVNLPKASILEIGPGTDFAPQLVFASMGANVALADRFLTQWDDDYHPYFYEAFLAKWDGPAEAIKETIHRGNHSVLQCVEEEVESMPSFCNGQFDLVVSNAVLEHVRDFNAAARELGRVSRHGALNCHQIDFRDHRTPQTPLEFLAMTDEEFAKEAHRANFQFGNRVRVSEAVTFFQMNNFKRVSIDTSSWAAIPYLADFLPRLRSSASCYRDCGEPDLMQIGANLVFKRV